MVSQIYSQIKSKGHLTEEKFTELYTAFSSSQPVDRRVLNIANEKILNFSKQKSRKKNANIDFRLGKGMHKIGEIGIDAQKNIYAVTKTFTSEFSRNDVRAYTELAEAAKKDPTIFDYIVRFKGFEEYRNKKLDDKTAIVTELALGDLEKMKASIRLLPREEKKELCLQLITGLKILHDLKIMHRDLKTENIFVFKDENNKYKLKIGDFDFSCFTHAPQHVRIRRFGSALYMCKEYYQKLLKDSLDKQDIWAMGLILYEILNEQPSYFKFVTDAKYSQDQFFDYLNKLETESWFRFFDDKDNFEQAIRSMLTPAKERPSIADIYNSLKKQ